MNVKFDLRETSGARPSLLAGLKRLIPGGKAEAPACCQVFVQVVLDEWEKAIAQKYHLDQLTVWKGPEVLSTDKEGRDLRSFPFLIVATQLLEEQPMLLLRASTRDDAERSIRTFSASLRAYRLRIMDFDYDAVLTPLHPEPANSPRQFSI